MTTIYYTDNSGARFACYIRNPYEVESAVALLVADGNVILEVTAD